MSKIISFQDVTNELGNRISLKVLLNDDATLTIEITGPDSQSTNTLTPTEFKALAGVLRTALPSITF
ncbi:hypothetical protein CcrC1_gp102 [Caulobacter phage C1]|nr:hypothetical protein CcrC1_gp102 [Caulobacter phage C1]UTU08330.1 hypothetical protein CcrC2_gp102 [Caulobacter phage C2]UTU08850.1 hypothetical protein CcrJ4_gp099 [Caulobacter phage J4]UTU09404.1 hypothetical protein CcrBL47_gp118 [Caulobacter phage BL47]UTU09964.1 hypothetical protein CcrRB23_gp102 [Caulobacter phage RB23]WGN96989.1 hypothetical protein [Bertelyvirus sp.]